MLADFGQAVQRPYRNAEHVNGLAGAGNVGDVQRKRPGVREDPFGEAPQRWRARQFAHQCVDVLGVVLLLADPGGAPNCGQAIAWVRCLEREVEAEERVTITRFRALVASGVRRIVQAHRHFHAHRAEVTVAGFEPAPQPAGHDGENGIVDCRAVGRGCGPA